MCVFFLVRIYPSALFSMYAFFRVRFFPSALFPMRLYTNALFSGALFSYVLFSSALFSGHHDAQTFQRNSYIEYKLLICLIRIQETGFQISY